MGYLSRKNPNAILRANGYLKPLNRLSVREMNRIAWDKYMAEARVRGRVEEPLPCLPEKEIPSALPEQSFLSELKFLPGVERR